jgi:DNA-binding CsgD family transcriptional regulator
MGINRALDLIAHSADEKDVDALVAEFRSVIRDFGFDCSAAGAWVGVGKARRHRFFFNDWPQDWLDFYNAHGYFQRDFIVEESIRRSRPFLWSELGTAFFSNAVVKEFFDATRHHGWIDGFAVPIHGASGYQGLVSLAAKQSIVLDPTERAVLEALARAVNERCRAAIGYGVAPIPLPSLTARELECLRWAAGGKTDWEIGELLGISKSTAHFHVEQAKKKLGVSSRIQAVALLGLHGLV